MWVRDTDGKLVNLQDRDEITIEGNDKWGYYVSAVRWVNPKEDSYVQNTLLRGSKTECEEHLKLLFPQLNRVY